MRTYIVQPGETLIDVAVKLMVSPTYLAMKNNLGRWDAITPGMELYY